jgi:hypothetical protein
MLTAFPQTEISVFADGSLQVDDLIMPPVVSSPLLARLKHDCERTSPPARSWGDLQIIPQPFRAQPGQTIPVKNYPGLFDLLCALNPSYTRDRARQLLDPGLCWCNAQWGVMTDSIITGGAVLEVEQIENSRVYFRSILISNPVPSAEYVLSHHLSTIATSVKRDGTPRILTRPNGYRNADGSAKRSPVRMFIVRSQPEPLWFPAEDVQLLPPGFEPPDVLWMP